MRIYVVFFTLMFTNCYQNNVKILGEIDYAYKVIEYVSYKSGEKKPYSYKFYNKDDKLIQVIWSGEIERIYYDSVGNIEKIFNTTEYDTNRTFDTWEFYIKDDFGNIIGIYKTHNLADSIINVDTIDIQQVKYYNKNNQLVKEVLNDTNELKFYFYEDSLLLKVIETMDNDTTQIKEYTYSELGHLKSIYSKEKRRSENETFEYDQRGNLIKYMKKFNNKYVIDGIEYRPSDYTEILVYDKDKLIEKTIYDDEKINRKLFYEYE